MVDERASAAKEEGGGANKVGGRKIGSEGHGGRERGVVGDETGEEVWWLEAKGGACECIKKNKNKKEGDVWG